MRVRFDQVILLIAIAMGPVWLGCSGKPARVKPPKYDPQTASQSAMDMYDANKDGYLDSGELDAAPEIKGALKRFDSDKDGRVSAAEVVQLLEGWSEVKAGSFPATCTITLNGKALDGASVVFEPAPFVSGGSPAEGVSDAAGRVTLKSPVLRSGMQFGLYRIRISKQENGKEIVPAKYNTETTLGAAIDGSSPAVNTTAGLVLDLE